MSDNIHKPIPKIHKVAAYWIIPLMLMIHTVAENIWIIFGLMPDIIMYAIIIGLAAYLGFMSIYRNLVAAMFSIWVGE